MLSGYISDTMSKKYRTYNPNQTFLLPPDIRDWLPENHLSRFINDVVDDIDISPIFAYYEAENRGNPPYHPRMLLKVLLYSYCVGMSSSRKIGKSLHEDVAFRFLSAGNFPNFRTISDFRKIHLDKFEDIFIKVLELCQKAGLVKLGTVALDGMKIKANASLSKSQKYSTLCTKEEKEEDKLRKLVRDMLDEAERVDEEEDRIYGENNRGDELPDGFRTTKERLERIREAKRQLEEEQEQKHKKYQNRVQSRNKEEKETGKKVRGRKLKAVPEEPTDDVKRNTTDPDSRIMKTRKGHIQGYNAQAIVDCESQIIVAADLVQDENDKHQQVPMMKQVEQYTGRKPKKSTMDAGYWDEKRLKEIDPEIDLYVATDKDWKTRKKLRNLPCPRGRIPKSATFKERMERKLLTKKGRKIYKKRGSSVEPAFGQIQNRGFDKLSLRGKKKGKGEWILICLSHNLLKLSKATASG